MLKTSFFSRNVSMRWLCAWLMYVSLQWPKKCIHFFINKSKVSQHQSVNICVHKLSPLTDGSLNLPVFMTNEIIISTILETALCYFSRKL